MNKSITVKFTNDEWLPVTRDGSDYRLCYSFVDSKLVDKPEESFHTKQGQIIIGISGTLETMWGLNRDGLQKVLFEYGKRHLETMISEGAMVERTEVQLTTASAPKQCPFDPKRINILLGTPFEFLLPSENPLAGAKPSSLAFQIVDLRDSINAIFGEKYKERLLTLPQERHLVELFKSCDTHEKFAYRVASLGGLVTAIEPKALKALIPMEKTENEIESSNAQKNNEELKPLDLLGIFLRCSYPGDKVSVVMESLVGFNHLRRMYPIHTDRAKGVLSAHRFFDLDYPVSDYQKAWLRLLERYRDALEALLALLKT